MTKAKCSVHGEIEALDLDPHMPTHHICPVCFANWAYRKFGVRPAVIEPFPFPIKKRKEPTTCPQCSYDGRYSELLEQCATCKAIDDAEAPKKSRAPTSCGYCSYEEADGELIEQCSACKAADATKEG